MMLVCVITYHTCATRGDVHSYCMSNMMNRTWLVKNEWPTTTRTRVYAPIMDSEVKAITTEICRGDRDTKNMSFARRPCDQTKPSMDESGAGAYAYRQ